MIKVVIIDVNKGKWMRRFKCRIYGWMLLLLMVVFVFDLIVFWWFNCIESYFMIYILVIFVKCVNSNSFGVS